MIDTYKEQYLEGILTLWNQSAVKTGYKKMDTRSLRQIILDNPYFDPKLALVETEDGKVTGFACGCMGEDLPLGKTSGYITCVILDEEHEDAVHYQLLLSRIEETFAGAGKTQSEVLFFNPMKLPWYIKGTNRHEHNNAPGVFKSSRFYKELFHNGYTERTTEHAMYLNLEQFHIPDTIIEKEKRIQADGYEVTLFDKTIHYQVKEMLDTLNNPLWEEEIIKCTKENIPVLVAARNNKVIGFAGPVIKQENHRGYFTGIGVIKEEEGHGLGTILFYKLCEEEKKAGASYMSLFTGADNKAGKIYEQAGFKVVEKFAVMRKFL
ncbi:GNAT family N-acetyltransferase [Anaerocolumna sp. MB42-C2]|uniref:GNAT family N-acetyltransferase n=1 Tax=Anaerocolumna sp. MB42-C2 TaxID=3070997 RepID=UPI0027DF935F|nr:GNAT family N-acetyltransferase [Anaerocolumna sp. MB42-C2]WMJ86946.1 GNAT family N-acetyltransferase [Anaerocolumna sp. MB42-C2]